MMIEKKSKKKGTIQCALCGHTFEEGQKISCENCPLNYGNCHFEKCPNCGYDTPKTSFLWTLASRMINKLKR